MTEPTSFDLLARLVPSLALILGALLLVRWLARRGGTARGAGELRVLARAGLTRGAVVAIVAAGRRRFLVGAGEHGVALLSELEPSAVGDDLDALHDAGPGTLPGSEFTSLTGARAGTLRGSEFTTLPGALPGHGMFSTSASATDRRTPDRPWMAAVDRLRAMTVRSHLERPIRAHRG